MRLPAAARQLLSCLLPAPTPHHRTPTPRPQTLLIWQRSMVKWLNSTNLLLTDFLLLVAVGLGLGYAQVRRLTWHLPGALPCHLAGALLSNLPSLRCCFCRSRRQLVALGRGLAARPACQLTLTPPHPTPPHTRTNTLRASRRSLTA